MSSFLEEKKIICHSTHHQFDRWQSNPRNAAEDDQQKFKESSKALIVHPPTQHLTHQQGEGHPSIRCDFTFGLHQRHGITLIFFFRRTSNFTTAQQHSTSAHTQGPRQWTIRVLEKLRARNYRRLNQSSNLVSLSLICFLFSCDHNRYQKWFTRYAGFRSDIPDVVMPEYHILRGTGYHILYRNQCGWRQLDILFDTKRTSQDWYYAGIS